MKELLIVNNIKCGGCETTVRNSLTKIEGVQNIRVDASTGEVEFDYPNETTLGQIKQKLNNLGYTENDPNFVDTAKSYVSCMLGKIK
jgi:copper chaperone